MTRPRTSTAPPPPTVLVLGHVAVGVGVIGLAVLLIDDLGTQLLDTPPWLFALGLAVLLGAQILAIHRLLRYRREHLRGGLDDRTLVWGARRTTLTAVLAYYPLLFGLSFLATLLPIPAPALVLYCALLPASLLLDHTHAGWIYRHLRGREPHTRTLPPGSATRLRSAQRLLVVLLVVVTLIALILLIFTVMRQSVDAPAIARLVGVASASTATLLPLLLLWPTLRVRRAIHHHQHDQRDTVHLPTLDAASGTLRRLGVLGVVAAALTMAAVLSAPASLLAAAPVIPLTVALSTATSQLGTNTCLNLGEVAVRGWRPGHSQHTAPP